MEPGKYCKNSCKKQKNKNPNQQIRGDCLTNLHETTENFKTPWVLSLNFVKQKKCCHDYII